MGGNRDAREPERVLYRRAHGERMVEVVEDDGGRILAFDSHLTQSRMSLEHPHALMLRYTRRMMAGLLFLDAAAEDAAFRVLMIGLGGGSLAKFLLYHFSACLVDAVENDPLLPGLARRYFHLPRNNRLNVIIEDGARFFERGDASRYDFVLLDAYDQNGAVRGVYADPVVALAQESLTAHGVLAINVLHSDKILFRQVIEGVRKRFPNAALVLSVPGFSNEILFAGPGVPPWEQREALTGRAREFEMRLGMNFPAYLTSMTRLDRHTLRSRWFGITSWW
ncbi:MAG: hypothetical protein H7834_01755 [Magnetococcus sp. YQC-9]